MKYAATRDDPVPPDVIATAIVAACRAVGADPIRVGSGELDRIAGLENHERVIARARYYAGFALRCLYPDRNRTLLAAYVGTKRNSAGSFFSALDQRLQGGLSWWSQDTVDRIVARAAHAALVTKPKPSPPLPLKIGPLPVPKFEADHPAPRTGLDRFAARYGDADRITARATERRECRDLLAEAAANTAKLQAKLPKE